jgi:ABC-type amino acid transport substrate-binding protein
MKVTLILSTLLLVGALSTPCSIASELERELKSISLGVTKETLDSKNGKYSKRLFTKLLRNLGYKLKVVALPAIRLAQQTEVGNIDGELIRMSEYGKKRKFLTKVTEPHLYFSVVVYSLKKLKKLANTEEQSHQKYGYRKGIKVVVNELLKVSNSNQMVEFADINQAFKLLLLGRIHGFVGIDIFVDEKLKTFEKGILNKVYKGQTLKEDSGHVFLGPKFSHLAKRISKELKRMKKNGDAKKIKNQTEKGH